jgi:DNA modification methylase
MNLIDLGDVIVPDYRQRKNFDGIDELAKSITEVSLLQPIVLRDDHKTLVCGERRLKAVALLKTPYLFDGNAVRKGAIPYVTLSELSVDLLYQAELEENVCRRDLTWQEKAAALKRFHELRSDQASSKGETQTITATASEVNGRQARGAQITEVNNAILLAAYLNDPEVAAQGSVADALKVVRKQKLRAERHRLASKVDLTKSPHRLHLADSLIDAPQRYPGVFDVVVTDPPYGIEAHKKDTFDTDRHEYDDSLETFRSLCKQLPTTIRIITKPDAHVYVFCDIRRFPDLLVAFALGGFKVWPRPLIWDKGNTGSYGNVDYGPRACYDAILYARKGDRKVILNTRDVINIPQPTNLPHPAGKPPSLFKDLLARSAMPGNHVADLFGGSCPLYQAASELKCYATCWENHPDYIPMAQTSLAETVRAR